MNRVLDTNVAVLFIGLLFGGAASLLVGCATETDDGGRCECYPAKRGTTILKKATSEEEGFPDLEGALLDVRRVDSTDELSDGTFAAVLRYRSGTEIVQVEFDLAQGSSEP